jgi:hypothetical protein
MVSGIFLPIDEYLMAENFSRFLREQDPDDTWKEFPPFPEPAGPGLAARR